MCKVLLLLFTKRGKYFLQLLHLGFLKFILINNGYIIFDGENSHALLNLYDRYVFALFSQFSRATVLEYKAFSTDAFISMH